MWKQVGCLNSLVDLPIDFLKNNDAIDKHIS